MHDLMRELLELVERRRAFSYTLAVTLILGVYAFGFYLPATRDVAEARQKAERLRSERTRLQKTLDASGDLAAATSEVEAALTAARAQLPRQKEIPELLRQVSALGHAAGLDILLFRQEPERRHELYAEVPVQMAARGGYHQLAVFFDEIGRLSRIVNVTDLSIKEADTAGPLPIVHAAFSAVTYRFVENAAAAEPAKEAQPSRKRV